MSKLTPEFKYDWFTPIRPVMERFVHPTTRRILEIGSFEGLSTRWFLETCKDSKVVAIDHFFGGSDQTRLDTENLFARFSANTAEYSDRLVVIKDNSWHALRHIGSEMFDVCFVDGSHESQDVLWDMVNAFRCCRPNGLVIADDYTWENQLDNCPKVAIDAFLACYKKHAQLLHVERVAVIRKVCSHLA